MTIRLFRSHGFWIIIGLLIAIPLLHKAYSYNRADREQSKRESSPMIESNYDALIKVAGQIKCIMPPINTGNPCVVRIHDTQSGKIFRLVQADDVRRLYYSGTKTMSVEGKITQENTIEVVKVLPL